jgi:phosphatidylglycerophosphate synthase
VRSIRLETALGALGTSALLGILSATTGLDAVGWVVGAASGAAATGLLAAGRVRGGQPVLPADWVTLARALLTAGVAALVADSATSPLPVAAVVGLSSAALLLDNVDGRVARRTGTATPFGARFDGEVDAFLILVLSVAVSRDYGGWVLVIGLARYALLVAAWAVPWLAAPLPPRYWGKVVAAVQGIVLTAAVSAVLPRPVGMVAVGVALLLLAESFGRSLLWLFRTGAGPRTRRAFRVASALGAAAVVWAVLVAPSQLEDLTPAAFARIPLEGLILVAVGLLLPARPGRVLAVSAGVVLSLLAVLKLLDVGFLAQLGRPFNPVLDWWSFGPAVEVVRDSIGTPATGALLVLAGTLLALLVAVVVGSTIRLRGATTRHRRRSARGVAVLGGAWALSAVLSLQLAPAGPVASTSAAGLALAHGRGVGDAVRDEERFDSASASDGWADAPGSELLAGLRGKDVLFVFVESYGKVALQEPTIAPGVTDVLHGADTELSRAGFETRSAFLDSPTFGGYSWLAHATLQSGLWIDSQPRHDRLMDIDRRTLASAFGDAGWRTVGVNPANGRPWPEGRSFYHYDQLYGRHDLGYEGPAFSWAAMPDQYTLAAFERLELTPGHRPVMAEIDLVSSHQPWTPLPRMVPWDELGDGSVFAPMATQGPSPEEAFADPGAVRRLYGQSVEYALGALTDWFVRLDDDDLVLVLLGDHQPATAVSGADAGREVPISLLTSDPEVLDRVAGWGWQDGLLPDTAAPVWPMDAFRDRFLDAFTATPGVPPNRPAR